MVAVQCLLWLTWFGSPPSHDQCRRPIWGTCAQLCRNLDATLIFDIQICLCACSRRPNSQKSGALIPRLTSKQMLGVRGLLKVSGCYCNLQFQVPVKCAGGGRTLANRHGCSLWQSHAPAFGALLLHSLPWNSVDAHEGALFLQAFPTEGALADALRKQKPLLANKKRISRLKRIILKERGDKALIDATEGASRAVSSAERARARRDSIQQQLRVCGQPAEAVRTACCLAGWDCFRQWSSYDALLAQQIQAKAAGDLVCNLLGQEC